MTQVPGAPYPTAMRRFGWVRFERHKSAGTSVTLLGRVARLPAVPSLLAVGIALWLWQAVAERGLVPAYILPLPRQVFTAWTQLLMNGALARHISATLSEALFGFAIAFVAGAVLAYPLARSETLSRLFSPSIASTQAVPMIAMAPLLVMWFGLGLASKVIICGLIVFFPHPGDHRRRAAFDRPRDDRRGAHDGRRPLAELVVVEVPLALRPVLGGVRMGVTLAITGAIVGEFVASDGGLGFLMVLSRTNFDAAMVFAASLTTGAISMLLYKVIGWLERALIDW